MKKGLVMEGGAMRGMFTDGVIDVMMEHDIRYDGAIGVSAGAAFGCNYKSGQIGRVIRYNKKYCRDPRYVSLRSLVTTGDLYGAEFAYHELPEHLDVFDRAAFEQNPMEFYVVCTDVATGKPYYHRCTDAGEKDLLWLRASASMPLVSRYVAIEGKRFSDGGTADSIPIRYLERLGYQKNVVILTQPKGYVKKPNAWMPLLRCILHRDRALLAAMETRHLRYNETLAYLAMREKRGDTMVIRPDAPLEIGAVEHNPNELERVYRAGRRVMQERLAELQTFLAKE